MNHITKRKASVSGILPHSCAFAKRATITNQVADAAIGADKPLRFNYGFTGTDYIYDAAGIKLAQRIYEDEEL